MQLAQHLCGRCNSRVAAGRQCPICAPRQQHRRNARNVSSTQLGYSVRWRRARLSWLIDHPVCADPYRVHDTVPALANVVDHVRPHRGDIGAFWDTGNWQSLCTRCHAFKSAAEDGGFGNARRESLNAATEDRLTSSRGYYSRSARKAILYASAGNVNGNRGAENGGSFLGFFLVRVDLIV